MAKKTEKKAPKASKPSSVDNPVKVVHETCERMLRANPKLARKDVMAALAGKVNRHTVSTQWQRWNAARKQAKK